MRAHVRVVATVSAAILAAAAISLASPASYSARASVFLQTSARHTGTSLDHEAFMSAAALAKSDATLGPVAELANLPVNELRDMVTETPVPDSLILDINTIAPNPDTAATISNAIANAISSTSGITDSGSDLISVVRVATPPTAPLPVSWLRVIFSGLVAGAIIALSTTIVNRTRRMQQASPQKEAAPALP